MYIGSWKIGDLCTFSVNTHSATTGAEADADSVPTYRVYEDETGTPILTGSMAKLDDTNTLGYYSEQITLSSGNGFEKGKSYNIRISATVGGVAATTVRFLQIEAEVDCNTNSDKTGYTASTVSDKTGYSLTQSFPSNFSSLGINASGHISRVVLADTLTTYTGNTPQTGDSFARIGATGSGLTSLAPSSTALSTTQWTNTRAGYLDNLNIGGNVASSSEVTAIQNNTRVVRVVPNVIERPEVSTQQYRIELFLYDETGNMEAPDSAPTVDLVNSNGDDYTGRLDSTTMTLVETGRYRVEYTADVTDDLEQLMWVFTVIEGGVTRKYGNQSIIVDTNAVDFTSADRTKLNTLAADYTTARATKLDNLDVASSTLATSASITNLDGKIDTIDNLLDTEIAAIKAVTDKLDTTWVLDGSVYQFTVNALENAPGGGGGGGTDWNADEKTAIKAILGIPASGTTPADPTTGILDTIRNLTKRFDTTKIIRIGNDGVVTLYTPTTLSPADVGTAVLAAYNDAEYGDTIYVNQDADINTSLIPSGDGLAKDGLTWVLGAIDFGTTIGFGLFTPIDTYDFNIYGKGRLYALNAPVFFTSSFNNVVVECDTIRNSGSYVYIIDIEAGNYTFRCNRITGENTQFGSFGGRVTVENAVIDCLLSISNSSRSYAGTILRNVTVDTTAIVGNSITTGTGISPQLFLDRVQILTRSGSHSIFAAASAFSGIVNIMGGGVQYNSTISNITLVYDKTDVAHWRGVQPNGLQSGRVDSYLGAGGAGVIDSILAPNLDTAISTVVSNQTTINSNVLLNSTQASVDLVKAQTDKFNAMLEDDGGTYRYTANALEQAPTGGGGGGATPEEIADAVWDEVIANHTDPGSAGELIAAAGTAGDPLLGVVEGSYTLKDIMRFLLSFHLLKTNGGGTNQINWRDLADTKNRITMTVDNNSNRMTITLDPSD